MSGLVSLRLSWRLSLPTAASSICGRLGRPRKAARLGYGLLRSEGCGLAPEEGLNAGVRRQRCGVPCPGAALRATQRANLGLRGAGRRLGLRPLSLPLRGARIRPDVGAALERAGIRRARALRAAAGRARLDLRRPLPRSAGPCRRCPPCASVLQLRAPRWSAAGGCPRGLARVGRARAAGAGVRELRGAEPPIVGRTRACPWAGHIRAARCAAGVVVLGRADDVARLAAALVGADVARRRVASCGACGRALPHAPLFAPSVLRHRQSGPRRLGHPAADAERGGLRTARGGVLAGARLAPARVLSAAPSGRFETGPVGNGVRRRGIWHPWRTGLAGCRRTQRTQGLGSGPRSRSASRAHGLGACRGSRPHRSWPRACGRRRSARGREGGARCSCLQPEPDHARGEATRGRRCRRVLARPRLARSRAAPTARRWCARRRSHRGKRRSRSPFRVSRQRSGCDGREPDEQRARAARRAIVAVPPGLRGADARRAMAASPQRQLGRRRHARFPQHRPRGVAAAGLVAGGRGPPTGRHGAVAFPHDGAGRGLRADRRPIRAPRLDRRWHRLRTAHASETHAPVRAALRQPA